MSHINALIAKHVPNGVPFQLLGTVAPYSDTRVDANDLDATTFVGVDNLLPDKGGRADASYLPNTERLTAYRVGDVLVGNIRPYLKKVWLATNSGGCSGDVLAFRVSPGYRSRILPKFLYYLLSSDDFFAYDMQHARGGKMPRGDKASILKYRIPIPPVEVQREIVRVLDMFTTLEAELKAELDCRLLQYAHYRTKVLSFPADGAVRWSTLGEISAKVSSGATPLAGRAAYYEGGSIPWLRTQEIVWRDIWDTQVKITDEALRETAVRWIPQNCVIVAISGATAARAAVNKIPLTTNQHCCNLEIDSAQASYRYVFHWVTANYEKLKSLGQGVRSDLNSGLIKSFPIAVPPLQEQERIASLLDKFDALIHNPSVGLPAELSARRKQFEYYRDRLLTFEEAVA